MHNNRETMYQTTNDTQTGLLNTFPMVDAHMHIQTNDIAPIPIARGVQRLKLSVNGHLKHLFCNAINFGDELSFLKHDIEIMPDFLKKLSDLPFRTISSVLRAMAEIGTGFYILFGHSERRSFNDAMANPIISVIALKEYGKVTRHNSFQIAGIYFNEVIGENMPIPSYMKTIVDTKSVKKGREERRKLTEARRKERFNNANTNYFGKEMGNGSILNTKFELSVLHTMELMYAHYWGVYGIPIYIMVGKKLYFIVNGDYLNTETGACFLVDNIYDLPEPILKKYYRITDVDGTPYREKKEDATGILIEKFQRSVRGSPEFKYAHFLEEAQDTEFFQFEDFEKHLAYTKMAVLRYPFKLLPFYHVDPRRFFSPPETEIANGHDFYIKMGNNKLAKVDSEKIGNALCGNGPEKIFTYKMNIDKIKEELLTGKGIFWGIKMYAALGYPPCLYHADDDTNAASKEIRGLFPALPSGAYSEMRKFYDYCQTKEVPIVCHCSPLAMTIADSSVFLKEYLKSNNESNYAQSGISNFLVDDRENMIGLGLIDSFSSPEAWKIVLEDFSKLKLCLAHFGGRGFFRGDYDKKTCYDWVEKINSLLINDKYEKIYTDISNFVLRKSFERRVNTIRKTGDRLFELIQSNPKLKKQILFGTDWPMLETDITGMDLYKKDMFRLLKELTLKLKNSGNKENGGKPWDVWHQWTIINPLRFLGLLKEGKAQNGTDCYTIDTEKFTTMQNNMKECYKTISDEYSKHLSRNVAADASEIGRIIDSAYDKSISKRYVGLQIPLAENIVDANNNLLILGAKES